ncbi:MAG TPA: archaeosortase/exosortase family protein [Steroidobacteraceae bacterium]|nr:archaeosortase/exosortase family protein [Steroidobacteraceae bacterium]
MKAAAARVAAFLGVFTAQQLAWQALRGSFVERFVIDDATVRPAALLIDVLTPSVHVTAVGAALSAPGGGLSILNGCEGLEALFLLTAAFAIAPLPTRLRWRGLLIGVPVVFFTNQLRILALFYAYRANTHLFEPLHGTVTPIAVVLVVSMYFYAWLRRARPITAPA